MDALARPRPARPLGVAFAVLLLTTCAGPRGGSIVRPPPEAERRVFPVLEYGALDLAIPAGWTVKVLELEPGTPTSIRLDAPGGGVLFLAPLFNPDPPVGSPGLETARSFAEVARIKARSSATEPELPIAELSGSDGVVRGYWFVATDRDYAPPAAGEQRWRNMLRGAAAVGRLLVSFTWFDDEPGPGRDQVLALMADARHAGGGTPPPAAGAEAGQAPLRFQLDPGVGTVPLSVPSPGGTFSVLVDLPGFRMFAPQPSPDGEGLLVLGQHPETGVVASVTIGPARGATSARTCRDRKVAAVRRVAPELGELSVSDAGPASRASYVLRELRGEEVRQEHAHAFLERDAWCIDVHVSKAAPEPGDPARLEALLASVRFAERL